MSGLHVIYTASAEDGKVLYDGYTPWARWTGWEYCMGACVRRRRSLHRMCEHMTGQDNSWRWCRKVDWDSGPFWSRTPKAGLLTYRIVLGTEARAKRIEDATILEHRPLHNVAHNPARASRAHLRSVR